MHETEPTKESPSLAAVVAARGSLSSQLAARSALRRAAAARSLNAFVTIDEDFALAAARTFDDAAASEVPLRGVTLAVKDNVHVRGLPNTAGTPALRNFMPPDTSPVVERLQRLGAVVLGKTGLHELAYGITNDNLAFGAVRNPLDQDRTPGGSSGGTAAAVAAGIVTIGIGTDTGGSVRLPAALTGTVGYRPTTGLYSSDAVTLISNTRDTLGIMARTVTDTALLHSFIVQEPVVQPVVLNGLRLGVPHGHFMEMLDSEVDQVFADFLTTLEAAGAVLVRADMNEVPELNDACSLAVCLYETAQLLPAYLERYDTGVTMNELVAQITSPDVSSALQAAVGGVIAPEVYAKAVNEERPALQRAYARYFERHRVDAVVFPTSPITARPIANIRDGVVVRGELHDTFRTYIRNVDPASNAGIPALSLPAGTTRDGLAVGAEIECLAGEDRRLLGIALGIEAVVAPLRRSPNKQER